MLRLSKEILRKVATDNEELGWLEVSQIRRSDFKSSERQGSAEEYTNDDTSLDFSKLYVLLVQLLNKVHARRSLL